MTRLRVPVHLRWSDLDAYSHVNNVEMLRLLEEARIEAFWRHPDAGADQPPTAILDAGPGAGTTTLVARQEIEYLVAMPYRRRPVVVELWLGHLGGASVEVCYEVSDGEAEPTVYARASATLVMVDTASGAPRRITDDERRAWAPYVEAPIEFRRRR
jgi:acyl-CoA thioester hydrolase